MTENERLKIIRNELKLTQKDFSDALEIKQGSYSDVERGKAGISALLLKNLIRKFRVNPLWLCEGEGAMFIRETDGWSISSNIFSDDVVEKHEGDSVLQLLRRQQQYINNIKDIVDFLGK